MNGHASHEHFERLRQLRTEMRKRERDRAARRLKIGVVGSLLIISVTAIWLTAVLNRQDTPHPVAAATVR